MKKLAKNIFLYFSLILFIYTFYRDQIFWNGIKFDFYKNFYLLSIILFLFSIIIIFFSKKINTYINIVFFSVISFFYCAEIYLTFNTSEYKKIKEYEKNKEIKFDRRSAFQFYQDNLKKNKKLTFSLIPLFYLDQNKNFLPLSGLSKSNVFFFNENGYYPIYKSDRHGFNNPDYEWDKNIIDYLIIGDSFAHGCCVNRPHDISSALRTISKSSVLNLGMGGSGPLIEYAIMREYISKKIKKVIWFYYEGNDLDDLRNEKRNKILLKYLEDKNFSQNLKNRQDEVDIVGNDYIKTIYKKTFEKRSYQRSNITKFLILFNLRTLVKSKFQKKKNKEINKKYEYTDFKKIILKAKSLANLNNSKFYFVYLPEYRRYKDKNYNLKNYNNVIEIIQNFKIPIIDINKLIISNNIDPISIFPFREKGHYTVDGYKFISEQVFLNTK